MAKVVKTKRIKKTPESNVFPFERENYIILGVGLVLIVIGYIALLGNTVEGFSQLTVAPILLVLGYCVVIPLGILYRKKEKTITTEVKPVEAPKP